MSRDSHARIQFPDPAAGNAAVSAVPGLKETFRAWSAASKLACHGARRWAALFDPAAGSGLGDRGGLRRRAPAYRAWSGSRHGMRSFHCPQGSRDYRLYVPKHLPDGARGLVLMLHGCKQDADDFAHGTRMNDLADTHGLIVAWPNQNRLQNALGCWRWFDPCHQRRGTGEPAILAALARSLAAAFSVPGHRIFAAGLSAGGGMATILGAAYPELFAAIGVHSGLPCGAASNIAQAYAAMRGEAGAATARLNNGAAVPTIIFQGDADTKVHADNARRILRLAVRGHAGLSEIPPSVDVAGGRSYSRRCHVRPDGTHQAELWMIEGAGHVWSGGEGAAPFTDDKGPDASAEMIRFFLSQAAGRN